MRLIERLLLMTTPRYVVGRGMCSDEELKRLAHSQPGDVIALSTNDIKALPGPILHLHIGNRRRMPTAAMAPTLRAKGRK